MERKKLIHKPTCEPTSPWRINKKIDTSLHPHHLQTPLSPKSSAILPRTPRSAGSFWTTHEGFSKSQTTCNGGLRASDQIYPTEIFSSVDRAPEPDQAQDTPAPDLEQETREWLASLATENEARRNSDTSNRQRSLISSSSTPEQSKIHRGSLPTPRTSSFSSQQHRAETRSEKAPVTIPRDGLETDEIVPVPRGRKFRGACPCSLQLSDSDLKLMEPMMKNGVGKNWTSPLLSKASWPSTPFHHCFPFRLRFTFYSFRAVQYLCSVYWRLRLKQKKQNIQAHVW